MAIAKMNKVMIVSHRSEAKAVLGDVQRGGIVEVLDAERAMVTKEWPELMVERRRSKDIEGLIAKLESGIEFLNAYLSKEEKPSVFAPLTEVGGERYGSVVGGREMLEVLDRCLACKDEIDKTSSEIDGCEGLLDTLGPWAGLETDLELICGTETTNIIAGVVPGQNFEELREKLGELDCVIEVVNETKALKYCIVAIYGESAVEAGKILRNHEFEQVHFEGLRGSASDMISMNEGKINDLNEKIAGLEDEARALCKEREGLGILYDHYKNLLNRENTRRNSPATDNVILLEGWVRRNDMKKLEAIVSKYKASSVDKIEVAKDEEIPMEIDNNAFNRPFETITRLHGMPNAKAGDVDPTAFLAPFFALFFGLCLTDAGYGIIMAIAAWWFIKKLQGDKKAMWMFLVCSLTTIFAGAVTGGWFGDALQVLIPEESGVYTAVNGYRNRIMLFDPMKEPITFFVLSIGLGYLQIMFALFIGLFNNMIKKDYATAVFNFLTWIIFLNSLVLYGVSKAGVGPLSMGKITGWVAVSQAVLIFFFSERNSGMAGRIGGGVFSLFSTVFYFGDILSYVRLMALGMVTAGLGMAVNILVQLLMDVPYVGFILGAVLFVVGHTLNMALSVLSSFVHSLRLQFVEFFPKFFTGGGTEFRPLTVENKYMLIKKTK